MVYPMTLPTYERGDSASPRVPGAAPSPFAVMVPLAARVEEALRATGYPHLHQVSVQVRDRTVTLRGRVPTFYMKLLCQETAMTVPGIERLVNELDVISPQ